MIYEKSVGQMGPGGFMKVRWQKNELSWRELLGATTMVFVAMPPPGPLGFRQAGCSHIISARGGGVANAANGCYGESLESRIKLTDICYVNSLL